MRARVWISRETAERLRQVTHFPPVLIADVNDGFLFEINAVDYEAINRLRAGNRMTFDEAFRMALGVAISQQTEDREPT